MNDSKIIFKSTSLLLAPAIAACLAMPASAADVIYQAEEQTWSQAVFETTNAGYTGTGYVNTNNVAGSYVEFTVEVPSDGNYSLASHYANGTGSNRPIDLSINGEFKLPQLSSTPTGSWATWNTESFSVNLLAGSNTIRMIGAGNSGAPNIDALTVTIDPLVHGVAYQAENQSFYNAVVENEHTGYTGTGYVNGSNDEHTYIEFTVSVPNDGTYNAAFRFANGGSAARPTDLAVNGEFKIYGPSFSTTGGWTSWATEATTFNLTAGENTITLIGNSPDGPPNLDSLTISPQ
ncbi:carbohydrate-binding protein [Marinagarivorans cellulosilyticus]|uniref:CBM6 domain-containing protein n=1 Tax=Marinagarivorans cellulosilyticus TaxID=2721545 RepID=A0AAN1WE66_9GAMM|nr:carbohydrate-binding protein [Marinagarivorans cellulosilyticus]BCD95965.1 hypothetical protein MARGE09_P0164 [Marinagarivorans cellulosilyticus]